MATSRTLLVCAFAAALICGSVVGGLLDPISTARPSATDFPEAAHPKPPNGYFDDALRSSPVQTNKFWGNLIYDSGLDPVITQPYAVRVSNTPSGLGISHADNYVTGGGTPDRVQYYFRVFLYNMGLGATEAVTSRKVTAFDMFSANLKMTNSQGSIDFPLVRGMAYVTALYNRLSPMIFTQHAILSVNGAPTGSAPFVGNKFKVSINNGQTWLIYFINEDGSLPSVSLNYRIGEANYQQLYSNTPFTGIVRVTQLPSDSVESILDAHRSIYPKGANLAVSMTGSASASYTFNWILGGPGAASGVKLLHYTLPHHRQIISSSATPTSLTLVSTTKGDMTAYIGNSWTLNENGFTTIEWLPPRAPDSDKVSIIRSQLATDINMDISRDTSGDSNYFNGKSLQKYALLLLVAESFGETGLVNTGLAKLKSAFQPIISRTNKNPLRYDTTWKGIIGQQGLYGDALADFGSTYYNDHHYHYGYFIFTAAVIGKFDPSWKQANAVWIDSLVRDVANPSLSDPYFPMFRAFDWFSGHSWSQGLFPSADGKDQESTSEEVNFLFGLKMWGKVTDRADLSNLGAVMLAMARRSINTYFLMDSNNKNHPREFIGNKVTGIFFENKCDYATWFGSNPEYIHGIQMLPMTAVSEEIRYAYFVAEEWPLIASRAPGAPGGWSSVLYTNYAMINKNSAFASLQTAPLDDGLTRTWALFFAATRPSSELERPVFAAAEEDAAVPIRF
eukprot:TRINITY_DN1271_c0_g1_i1.p1 TRINITY_DN1271_c0_g1~~TRINITY_DN1271_c0_g1_i1.p1  ORF type:complete len:733 (-),score=162.35 TRINITY_DN1271_c0_g1_i1:87-2285(-)